MVLTFLCAFVVATFAGLRLQKYESHLSIVIGHEEPTPGDATESVRQTGSVTNQEVDAEARMLKNRDLLRQVVLANGLENEQGSSFLSFPRPQQAKADRVLRAVETLTRQLRVQTRSKSNQVELTYSSLDPGLAYGVLNSLRNFYLEKHPTNSTSDSYPDPPQKVWGYKAALDDAEAGLSQFRQAQGLSDANTGSATQLTAAASQSRAIEQVIAADERRIQRDQEEIKVTQEKSGSRTNTETDDPLLQNLGNRLRTAETKRAHFLLKYAPNYPLVRDADHEVAEAKAAIAAAEKGLNSSQATDRDRGLASLREKLTHDQADVANHRASLAAIERGGRNAEAQIIKPSGRVFDEADVESEAKADEQSYLLYLSTRERKRTASAFDRRRPVTVTIAAPPTLPSSPAHRRGMIVLIAMALATFVSLPAAIIVDCLDRGFHSADELIESLGITVVLAVPRRTA
ncbi:MAG TPA: hypothetical protein VFE27_03035 [Acidobacteriaceae bacterium]|nr:hypothetical protein [Acidobacteriaceae bacterium]